MAGKYERGTTGSLDREKSEKPRNPAAMTRGFKVTPLVKPRKDKTPRGSAL